MSLPEIHISLSAASGSSSSGSSMPNGTALYLTRYAIVAKIPGQRPRVITSLNGPLARTETHDRLDLPRSERERSVGLSSIPDPATQLIEPLGTSENSTHHIITSQPRTLRATKRKAEYLVSEPAQSTRFSRRLREKKEKEKREEMRSRIQDKGQSAKRRKAQDAR
ncbi:hypothetical protein FRC02_001750 [Tulasnella sp. 418]|nr:hypothetical protein FRC02_001750 [Tulasnella sp. 418]